MANVEYFVDLDWIRRGLHNLAFNHGKRYEQTREQGELDRSIFYDRILVGLCLDSHPNRSGVLNNLGSNLVKRFKYYGRKEDLEEATNRLRAALELRPGNHPNRSVTLYSLANSLQYRFQQYGQTTDLDEAITRHHAALELRPDGHPHRSASLNNLANALQIRFKQRGRTADLDEAIRLHHAVSSFALTAILITADLEEAIRYHHIALELRPDGHPDRSASLNNLAIALQSRFKQCGHIADLDEAIRHHRAALLLRPNGHPDHSMSLDNLAGALQARFEECGQTADLDEATRLHHAALEFRTDDHPDRSHSLDNLASALRTRFKQRGQTADLDEAIRLHRAALELCPDGHPDRSASLNNLAHALQDRFEQHGQAADLDEAIRHHCAALELYPGNHPNRFITLNNLAIALKARFEQHGQTIDLDESIRHQRAALDLLPTSHPGRSASLNNLAIILQTRFKQHGQTADLNEVIRLHRAALKFYPSDHLNRSPVLNNLASALQTRFEQRGQNADLDEAIRLHRDALELRPSGHPHRSTSLSNLASALQSRFKQHGQTADLDETIAHHRAALELRSTGHPDRSASLNNLANALQIRLAQHGQAADLDEAIRYHHAALELCPDGHCDRSMSLNNLASALGARFKQSGQTTDLDEAIRLHRAALELRPNGHPDRFLSLENLGNALQSRFQQHGRTGELEEAIERHHAALELCPEGHPSHSSSLVSLASSLNSRFKKFGVIDDFDECMRLFERATVHKFSSSLIRLEIAAQWAELARSRSHHTTTTAYEVAMLFLQRVLTVSPTLHTQHDFLSQRRYYGTLALNAVAYAIEGNRLKEAIEMLEQGRGLLWSQMRGLRTPLDHLAEVNKELADRFRDVSYRLESLTTSSALFQSHSTITGGGSSVLDVHIQRKLSEERLEMKKQLSNEQEEVINKIRQIPGFENFLEAASFKVLQQVASEGPVIVVNHSEYRSDVLIVLSREDRPVVCVPLDGEFHKDSIKLYTVLLAARKTLGAESNRYDEVLRGVMKMLWERVISKVVNKLNDLGFAEKSRIWWCPTSVLSALPFHAAGRFEDSEGATKYFLDKYVSSYTPTLGALVNARSGGDRQREKPLVLVVGDTLLKSATQETKNIKNCGIGTRRLVNEKASRESVIEALRKASWAHFVCHGNLNSNPFNSSFKLHGGGLALLDIVQSNVPNAEFAFLSACHTAEQSHEVAQDEVLHLTAAMQFSGFRSVIGSMWELLDTDGPFFARTVYEHMCNCDEGEARYKRAAAGLRKAAVELKERADVHAERWVNLIHIGA